MKQDLEAQRKGLLTRLNNIVEEAIKVQEDMAGLPHERGIVSRSLKPHSGAYVVSSENGFTARYQHTDGEWYEVSIHKREDSDLGKNEKQR